MKKLILYAAILAIAGVFISSCASTSGSNDYFGYDNAPGEDKEAVASGSSGSSGGSADEGSEWSNPLANGNSSDVAQAAKGDEDVYRTREQRYVNYNYYSVQPVYVPVVVPWWSSYYGWASYPSPYRVHISYYDPYRSWGFSVYDWYSPWYSHHPYHGYRWQSGYAWGYHNWYGRPYYSYSDDYVKVKRTNRNFGPSRGSLTSSEHSSSSDIRRSARAGYSAGTSQPEGSVESPDRGNRSSRSATKKTLYTSGSAADEYDREVKPNTGLTPSGNVNAERSARKTGLYNTSAVKGEATNSVFKSGMTDVRLERTNVNTNNNSVYKRSSRGGSTVSGRSSTSESAIGKSSVFTETPTYERSSSRSGRSTPSYRSTPSRSTESSSRPSYRSTPSRSTESSSRPSYRSTPSRSSESSSPSYRSTPSRSSEGSKRKYVPSPSRKSGSSSGSSRKSYTPPSRSSGSSSGSKSNYSPPSRSSTPSYSSPSSGGSRSSGSSGSSKSSGSSRSSRRSK